MDQPSPRADFGKKLKMLRKLRGMSQEELAEKLGVSQKVVSAYERNYRLPTADKIPFIAETLGTSANDLYGLEDSSPGDIHLRKATLWRTVEKLEKLSPEQQKKVLEYVERLARHDS